MMLSSKGKWMQDARPRTREWYGWVIRSAIVPVMYLQQEQCFRLPRPEISPFPWLDVRREARMLDIRSSMDFVKDHQSVNDFDALHTVRFVQHPREAAGFDAVHLVPHVPRVIFSDGPYERPSSLTPTDRSGCRDRTCTRPHTRRVVINALDTVTRSDGEPNMRLPPNLEELVVVFHGWGIVSGWAEHGYTGGDPVNVVRGPIIRALLDGVHVTVVNERLEDLEDGGRRSNVEWVKESLEYFIDIDFTEGHGWDTDNVKPLIERIEWLTLGEYRSKIGEEEFKIETMTDKAAQRKKYMCLIDGKSNHDRDYESDSEDSNSESESESSDSDSSDSGSSTAPSSTSSDPPPPPLPSSPAPSLSSL